MHRYTIREATTTAALYLAPRLREADKREIKASSGKEPTEILPECIHGRTYVLCVYNRPVALFGVHTHPENERVGIPWLVGTDELVRQHTRYFLRHSREWVEKLSEGYDLLINCTDQRNEVHHRWLMWCGFKFTQLHPEWGAEKRPFWQFEKQICANQSV